MQRDIDYAAVAVRRAIVGKFKDVGLDDLQAVAGDRTISIQHLGREAKGTRDDLLASIRKAKSYAEFWEVLEREGRCAN